MSTPWKITAGTPKWRFRRWFSSSIAWFLGSMLIFRGVICLHVLVYSFLVFSFQGCWIGATNQPSAAKTAIIAWHYWNIYKQMGEIKGILAAPPNATPPKK